MVRQLPQIVQAGGQSKAVRSQLLAELQRLTVKVFGLREIALLTSQGAQIVESYRQSQALGLRGLLEGHCIAKVLIGMLPVVALYESLAPGPLDLCGGPRFACGNLKCFLVRAVRLRPISACRPALGKMKEQPCP